VYRTGDGLKSYEQLLTESLPGVRFADKDNGALTLVKRGKSVIPREAAQAANGAKLQRMEMSTLQRATASPLMAMDSAATAETLKTITTKSGIYKTVAWRHYVKPTIDEALVWFDAVSILIFGALGMLIVIGMTARQNGYLGESIVKVQRSASRKALYINWCLFVFFGVELLLHIFGDEWGFISGLICFTIYCALGWLWINWMSPDGLFRNKKEAGGNERGLTKFGN
jgi:preprotein translocase subunit Sss1